MRNPNINETQSNSLGSLYQLKESLSCATPDRALVILEQHGDSFRWSLLLAGNDAAEHRCPIFRVGCSFWIETKEPTIGRNPILTVTRLEEIRNISVLQPLVRAKVRECISIKPR